MWIKHSIKRKEASDQDLVSLYKRNENQDDLVFLFDRYFELVYGVALSYLKDEEASKDAVMDIFVQLTIKVKKYEIKNFKNWLHVLTKNHCLECLRKKQRRGTENISQLEVMSLPIPYYDQEFELEKGDLNLRSCMKILSQNQKSCIKNFYYEEKSYKEIAITMNINTDKVRSLIQNGRRKLKNCLEKKRAINV